MGMRGFYHSQLPFHRSAKDGSGAYFLRLFSTIFIMDEPTPVTPSIITQVFFKTGVSHFSALNSVIPEYLYWIGRTFTPIISFSLTL
jgi:hypothetical protein